MPLSAATTELSAHKRRLGEHSLARSRQRTVTFCRAYHRRSAHARTCVYDADKGRAHSRRNTAQLPRVLAIIIRANVITARYSSRRFRALVQNIARSLARSRNAQINLSLFYPTTRRDRRVASRRAASRPRPIPSRPPKIAHRVLYAAQPGHNV